MEATQGLRAARTAQRNAQIEQISSIISRMVGTI
jgi:hypothetical protein